MKLSYLGLAPLVMALLSHDVLAADDHTDEVELEVVHVTASASGDDPQSSVKTLAGEELERSKSSSLGDTLSQQAGIQNAGFGAAVGRPVIRGLGGGRLKILQDGLEAVDASSISPDHAVATETEAAHKIEVLRGPATLAYGGGSIGGLVNVVGQNHDHMEDEVRLKMSYDTANSGRLFSAGVTQREGNWGWNMGGSELRTKDYEVPSDAGEVHIEEDGSIERHEAESSTLDNSDIESQRQLSAGVRYFGEKTQTSFSTGFLSSKFGLPGHGHGEEEHEDEDHHDEEEHEDEEHHDEDEHEHDEHEEEGEARVDMKSIRFAFEHVHTDPFKGAKEWKTQMSWTDYEHTEGHEEAEHHDEDEHDHEDEEHEDEEHEEEHEDEEHAHEHGLTTFKKKTFALRSELSLEPVSNLSQLVGVDAKFQEFEAVGAEALTPSTDTVAAGLFWLGDYELDALTISTGVRFDTVSHDPTAVEDIEEDVCGFSPDDVESTSFNDFSAAIGLAYQLSDSLGVHGSVTSASRAPDAEELYSCGPHESTFSYEVGNPDLDSEQSLNLELGLEYSSNKWVSSVAVYRNSVSDYIYANPQISGGDFLEEDGLTVYAFTQEDVTLTGAEFEVGYFINDAWMISTLADTVRGELDEGGYLPRMPADRVGLKLDYESSSWTGFAQWMEYMEQDRVAESDAGLLETPTEGFSLLTIGAGYHWYASDAEYHLHVKGTNLLDEVARYHTSFVKDLVPQPGRGLNIELSAVF